MLLRIAAHDTYSKQPANSQTVSFQK